MANTFLKAEWRKLVMANYSIDKRLLLPYLPHKTEIDLWNNTCYVSLVGFMFLNTRVRGIKIPFHVDFEEVNLRFYIRSNHHGKWKRGVVFIKEIVPRPALAWVANTLYGEHYETLPMQHAWKTPGDSLQVEYKWKGQTWNSLAVTTGAMPMDILDNSEEEFITEHYWGYTKHGERKTLEYGVEHPRWQVYETKDYAISVDFASTYGREFAFLTQEKPTSVFLAEGSEVLVKSGVELE